MTGLTGQRVAYAGLVLVLVSSCVTSDATPPLPQQPQRIFSLAPSLTEILFSLELSGRIVGVTAHANYPPEAQDVARVGSLSPNYETIIGLEPDLVVVDSDMNHEHITRLKALGVPVLGVRSRSLPELLETIQTLGTATGTQDRAVELVNQINQGLEAQAASTQALAHRPGVFVEVWQEPLMTAGADTHIHDLVERAGGRNIFGDLERYPRVSLEQLLVRDPEVIILTVSSPEDLEQRPGWRHLRAVQRGQAFSIDPDLISRPSPRVLQALEQLHSRFRDAPVD